MFDFTCIWPCRCSDPCHVICSVLAVFGGIALCVGIIAFFAWLICTVIELDKYNSWARNELSSLRSVNRTLCEELNVLKGRFCKLEKQAVLRKDKESV